MPPSGSRAAAATWYGCVTGKDPKKALVDQHPSEGSLVMKSTAKAGHTEIRE